MSQRSTCPTTSPICHPHCFRMKRKAEEECSKKNEHSIYFTKVKGKAVGLVFLQHVSVLKQNSLHQHDETLIAVSSHHIAFNNIEGQ